MADELTVSTSLAYEDSASARITRSGTATPDVTTKEFSAGIVTVGTSEAAIPLGPVAAPGWCHFKNLSTTGTISLRVGSGLAAFCYLPPGESACLRLGAINQVPYAIASVAGCRLEYLIVDT